MSAAEQTLAERISHSSEDAPAEATLKTSERVLARVTDGIYRQPGSALRELIANAYDADATLVTVRTDRPRFATISVEDNGRGMTVAALARMIENIGGSAKRQEIGKDEELGITSPDNALQSPGGRWLIGRIGIGLFSVSQLCQAFTIVTKVKGEAHRTIATVVLRTYGEQSAPGDEDERQYEAGKARIWRQPAPDVDTQGTTVTLTRVRPQARMTLRGEHVWASIDRAEDDDDRPPRPPKFHIGRIVGGEDSDRLGQKTNELAELPWETHDAPDLAFSKLVQCVWDEAGAQASNPKLSALFDDYLRMAWQLALSIPVDYVAGHPFAIPFGDEAVTYKLARNGGAMAAERIELGPSDTLGEVCGTTTQIPAPTGTFTVRFDDLELTRPVRFTGLKHTSNVLTKPMLFAARHHEDFPGVDPEISGGPLAFEAYVMWNSRIAPTEHQGSLIRIHGASGTGFDPSFMRYQIAESTRRTQISCEIFITKGFEGALNIDRESFNFAHPHVVALTLWLHNALRVVINENKRQASRALKDRRSSAAAARDDALDGILLEAARDVSGDSEVEPLHVRLAAPDEDAPPETADVLNLDPGIFPGTGKTTEDQRRRLETIASILAVYGVADALTPEDFASLLVVIGKILRAESQA